MEEKIMKVRKNAFFLTAVLLLLGVFTAVQPAAATDVAPNPVPIERVPATNVDPTFVAGNPKCTDLGYDFGFKPQPEPPPSGTYFFGGPVTFPLHALTTYSVTITSDGTYFDWSSTLGVDAVIVKGGPNANWYAYDPPAEAFSDTGLHSPINPNNNQPYAISHIEFCYDFEVDVSKTAETSFTRTYGWTIDKSATPEKWDLFTGDSGTSKYTVAVTKDAGTDSEWAVSGSILIENNTPFEATITGVSDAISGYGAVAVDCGVSFPYVLPAGQDLTCSYSTGLPDGNSRTNTATVTTIKTEDNPVGGGEGTAPVTFGEPTTKVNDSINVDDTNGSSWTFSDDGSVMYEKTFSCDGDEGTHNNTATIRETGQSDSASVIVACYALTVTKDAKTTFDRSWDWTIDKSADQTDLILSPGQEFRVNYKITVDASYMDDNHAVSGEIKISNLHPTRAAELTDVTDLVSPDIAATVDCDDATSVPADGMITCSYDASLPDASSRTNTATATLQNYDFAADGTATAAGTTDFSGSADVVFGDTPTNETDECIEASDTFAGFLEPVCVDAAPKTFTYSRLVGPYDACGMYEVPNTASFITNDTDATGSDSWTVNVDVPCVGGCTLTPGYWKTHSRYGPAPYDDTWAQIGEDTPFFLSGQSYYEVLWTPPQGGNAYYILAHAYIAAELNQLNGASIPADVQYAYDAATDLFEKYTPEEVADFKGKDGKETRAEFIEQATILDNYNNGIIGPGHCSEEQNIAGTDTVSMQDIEDSQAAAPSVDMTGDNFVNILDLAYVADRFGSMDAQADVNDDGIVNIVDLSWLAQQLD
jgi:hypothetical protein